MKFIRSQKSGDGAAAFVFQISKQEVEWLLAVLKFYPQLDSGYHQITQGAAAEIKAEQQLLEEAMAQRRAEHKRKLDKFLATPGRFRLEAPDQFRFTLDGRADGMAAAGFERRARGLLGEAGPARAGTGAPKKADRGGARAPCRPWN